MYISRFPILLNHVHASTALPSGSSLGIWKLNLEAPLPLGSAGRLPAVLAGQPPSIERMTFQVDDLVGGLS